MRRDQELGSVRILAPVKKSSGNAGSTLNVVGAKRIKEVQKAYLREEQTQNSLFCSWRTSSMDSVRYFPIPLALGCTFEPELLERLCEVTSQESVAAGAHVTFSPMVDLVRDARWGRCLESTGEDPYMNSLYAKAMVEGFQKGNE